MIGTHQGNKTAMKNQTRESDFRDIERWGKAYDTYFRDWLQADRNIKILDAGCGDGRLIHYFLMRGYINVDGVDLNKHQVTLALRISPRVVQANVIDYLEKKDNRYDLIACIDLIEHLKKDDAHILLNRFYKALKGGGRLILQTPNLESPWGASIESGDITHQYGYTPQSMRELINLCGYSNIHARQAGPTIHGPMSLIRAVLWKLIWARLALWNLAEVGHIGSGIYTRVFLMTAQKI
jgi:2-polyprenyl-3-methyl-5-hydroxy-6-metoxy-1,4-benzoquinol methylase